jgi:hypothetical protein
MKNTARVGTYRPHASALAWPMARRRDRAAQVRVSHATGSRGARSGVAPIATWLRAAPARAAAPAWRYRCAPGAGVAMRTYNQQSAPNTPRAAITPTWAKMPRLDHARLRARVRAVGMREVGYTPQDGCNGSSSAEWWRIMLRERCNRESQACKWGPARCVLAAAGCGSFHNRLTMNRTCVVIPYCRSTGLHARAHTQGKSVASGAAHAVAWRPKPRWIDLAEQGASERAWNQRSASAKGEEVVIDRGSQNEGFSPAKGDPASSGSGWAVAWGLSGKDFFQVFGSDAVRSLRHQDSFAWHNSGREWQGHALPEAEGDSTSSTSVISHPALLM